MKSLRILAIALFATGVATAQDLRLSDVPANLRNAFEKEYTAATDVEWEKQMDHYKVEFEIDRQDYDIWYDASGKVIKKEQELTESELPQAIRTAIKKDYSGYRVDEAEMIWHNDQTTYKVEIEKGWEELHLIFDSNGKVISSRKD